MTVPAVASRPTLARLRRGAWGLALGGLVACSGKGANAPTAQSEERQSEAEYDVARDLFYKGNPRAALDHALKAVQLDDGNAKALYFTSVVYLWFCSTDRELDSPDCRLADAESYARRAIKANGQLRDAQNLLGQILILEKRYPDAVLALEPLTKDPAYTASYLAWGNLGWAQVLAGRVDEGIVSLRNAVTQPRFCVGHYRLGVAYEKRGELALAESSYSSAVAVDDPACRELQDAWQGRAVVRTKLGRRDEARQDLQRCKEISSETRAGRACVRELAALAATENRP